MTSPRPVSYLNGTLQSLSDAGIKGVTIVADGPDGPKGSRTSEATLGIVPTFRRSLAIGLANHNVEFHAIFQDDIRVSSGLADWLAMKKLRDDSIYSLYSALKMDDGGWIKFPCSQWAMGFGACGLVVSKRVAKAFLEDRPPKQTQQLGSVLAQFCFRKGFFIWRHSPSLVQHIGNVSTLHGLPITEDRRAANFVETCP